MNRGRLALAVALPALLVVALAAAWALLRPAKSELRSYSCEFPDGETGAPGGGAVEVRNGEVQSLNVETYFPGLPGNLGYQCYLRATKGDRESAWKTDGLETTIELLGEPAMPDGDYARLVPVSGGYRIDLRNKTVHGLCGAGAALPREIVIVGTGKKCQTLWDPAEMRPTRAE